MEEASHFPMKYYLHPTSKEVYAYDSNVTVEQIKELQPDLFDQDGHLTEIEEDDLETYTDPDGTQKLNSLIINLKEEVMLGYNKVIGCRCQNCDCGETLKYRGNEEQTPSERARYRNYQHGGNVYFGGYDYNEEQTFDVQYKEALAYKKSNYLDKSVCPNLVTLASNRGRDLRDTVDKIIEKRTKKDSRMYKALGLKQKYFDIIDNAGNDVDKLQYLYDTRATWILF